MATEARHRADTHRTFRAVAMRHCSRDDTKCTISFVEQYVCRRRPRRRRRRREGGASAAPGERKEEGEGRAKGLISDIPLCVVIPIPYQRPSLSPLPHFSFCLGAFPAPLGKTLLLIHCDPILHQFAGRAPPPPSVSQSVSRL